MEWLNLISEAVDKFKVPSVMKSVQFSVLKTEYIYEETNFGQTTKPWNVPDNDSFYVKICLLDFLRMKLNAPELLIHFFPEAHSCLVDCIFVVIFFPLEMAELKDQLSLGGANVNQT